MERINGMSQSGESPSTEEILASLLDFFAASPEDQSRKLSDYHKVCEECDVPPHIDDPLVELAEALFEYSGNCTTTQKHPDTFFVGPLSQDVVLVMQKHWGQI
jgi:hypothetical protein